MLFLILLWIMVNYYQYLPLSIEDERWGLSVLNTGYTSVKANQQYPYRQHPSHHYFNWKNGRILNEYQLIYIPAGEGIFESASMPQTTVKEGTVILLFPGEWHRFRPTPGSGWNEYWIGFQGPVMDNIVKQRFFQRSNALLQIGYREEIIALFTEIMEQTKKERPGYQPLIAGIVLHLLGSLQAWTRQKEFDHEDQVESTINKAILLLRTQVAGRLTMQTVASELKVSYAWFRKTFKLYTGIAPQQYFIQLKIEKAKVLLNDVNRSVKEIAYELNFESPLYFSKLFKEKAGISPKQYRKKFVQAG